MDNQLYLQGLDGITFITSAEGMAKRVLKDLENSHLTKRELAVAYKIDEKMGGLEYPNIIKLGQLIQELSILSESIEDI